MRQMVGGSSQSMSRLEQQWSASRVGQHRQAEAGVDHGENKEMSVWQIAVSRCLSMPIAAVSRKKA